MMMMCCSVTPDGKRKNILIYYFHFLCYVGFCVGFTRLFYQSYPCAFPNTFE
ncbi:hypothetical protein DPEC_G00149590 [Dallia pectoralis]|uniref:Uncharacterized protein n=1 Tax=Dallia pectoralis TaxID=75939 RepID=A0ACC2GIV0_DALPE|nr:hypothetical protein DPEC_G00149590 [Dallia pectoralis]